MEPTFYGGIEAGGTKFVCAVGTAPDAIEAKTVIPTTSPDETLAKVVEFFQSGPAIQAMGIASFGPLDLNRQSPTYGHIAKTPKLAWVNTDLAGIIGSKLGVPVAIDTDVNGAALGELTYGAGKGLHTIAYMTVGTGIGVGCIIDGRIMRGIANSEIGHMLIPRQPGDDFRDGCPYHRDCLEGFASGTALRKRWDNPEQMSSAALALEAYYLGCGITNIITFLSPQRIIIGGGVMHQAGLLERVRHEVAGLLNGYVETPADKDFITQPALGGESGIYGALLLASASGPDAPGS
jgi:fructokinase